MIRKLVPIMLSLFFSIAILEACAASNPTPTVTTIHTATATLTPPTQTTIPPTLTPLAAPPTAPALLVGPDKIVGMVEVGGRSLYLHCEGEGSPTIILESGFNDSYTTWTYNDFYMNLTKITQTCAYDRANLGTSDPASKPRTAQDMVNDLHTMLVNAQISGPYVLVGHSIGGWIVRLYAGEFPDEVTGIVLLDSSHPDQLLRWSAILPTEAPNDSQDLIQFRNSILNMNSVDPKDPEGWDFLTSAEQVRAVTSLGDIPLTVLSRSIGFINSNPEINQSVEAEWLSMQKELAALSTNSQQYIIPDAGHYLWIDNPDAVVNYIRQAVALARSYMP